MLPHVSTSKAQHDVRVVRRLRWDIHMLPPVTVAHTAPSNHTVGMGGVCLGTYLSDTPR